MIGNLELKISILRTRRNAYEIAHDLGWHPTKISQIICGIYLPDEAEQARLARVIGVPVENIFPKPEPSMPVLT